MTSALIIAQAFPLRPTIAQPNLSECCHFSGDRGLTSEPGPRSITMLMDGGNCTGRPIFFRKTLKVQYSRTLFTPQFGPAARSCPQLVFTVALAKFDLLRRLIFIVVCQPASPVTDIYCFWPAEIIPLRRGCSFYPLSLWFMPRTLLCVYSVEIYK